MALALAAMTAACNMPQAADPDSVSEPSETWSHDDRVQGPDGASILIACGAMAECYQKAGDRCPSGYEVVDREKHDGTASAAAMTGDVDAQHGTADAVSVGASVAVPNGEMLVRCKGGAKAFADRMEARTVDLQAATCARAFERISALANQWADDSPDKQPADTLPSRGRFVAVCLEMPAEVQACLASSRSDECKSRLGSLPRASKHRLDAMFLKVP
jgi:hypothetical protein